MEHGPSVLMFIFSGALLAYAALMAITKDYKILPYRATVSVKPKNEKVYMVQLAKVVALAALVPILTGLTAFWNGLAAVIVFIVGLAVVLWIGTKIVKNE